MRLSLAVVVALAIFSSYRTEATEIDVTLSMPNGLTAAAGQTVTVPVNLSGIGAPFSLDAFQLIVEYDGSFFETPQASGFALGSLTSAGDYTGLDSVTPASTSFTILRFATSDPVFLTVNSTGSITTFDMKVKPGLSPGSSGYLRFLASQGSANTELLTLSGDEIKFSPVITSPTIQGLVTIPVPEPSALILGAVTVSAFVFARKSRTPRISGQSLR